MIDVIDILVFFVELICLYFLFKILKYDHNQCYSDMEKCGVAAMDCCKGMVGGMCYDCPYFVDINNDKKGE